MTPIPPPDIPPLRRASYTLHVASVAGLDREGAEPFPVFQLELVRLMDSVLDLFDEEPRFQHFTLDGQSILIEDYLSIRPENFERVEQAVQNGKLLIGPWYAKPALAWTSIEAIIRNLMIGLRTARVFGRPMFVGYLPDAVCLPGQLPQILKSFGIDTAIMGRTASDQAVEASWEGIDGTRIATGQTPQRAPVDSLESLKKLRTELAPYSQAGHLFIRSPWAVSWSEHADFFKLLPELQAQSQDAVFQSNPTAYAAAIATYARGNLLPAIRGDRGDIHVPVPGQDAPYPAGVRTRIEDAENALTRWIEPYAVFSENSVFVRSEDSMSLPRQLIQRLWRDLLANLPCEVVDDEVLLRFKHIESCARFVMDSLWPRGSANREPPMAALIRCSESGFRLTAVKPPEESDRQGVIVRGYNTGSEPIWVTLTPWRSFAAVEVVTMDEVPTGGKLALESTGAVRFRMGPHRILTFWFHD